MGLVQVENKVPFGKLERMVSPILDFCVKKKKA